MVNILGGRHANRAMKGAWPAGLARKAEEEKNRREKKMKMVKNG
jgi:hypothetical protein